MRVEVAIGAFRLAKGPMQVEAKSTLPNHVTGQGR